MLFCWHKLSVEMYIFVNRKDRITIQEKESELRKQKELELEAKKQAEERRIQTLKVSR